ncbi:hypothetical protein [Pelagibacterium halotolerans]|uniref:Uncharacterized protein n=1 Tax=Pelagibacterium halotolerans (strain DSM 22347 / JCM 15775 / CGMCC 1.7692 / B2) TaxID=1082931 RepID=G4RAG8_PELHB|nr:hypothetical protein [Pelagibacterium halotolerans]AEQ51518.1 hypothetical protein KKY_1498 [Pelagibacterium halotolerans B2]QJR18645.1 hypothetical protein HKM20_09480 [Pelagibacterium halotolerans]SEA15718.1 hypothetical protein SAMN05428936_102135 [Pelagibacterium halotolerans]
MRQLVFALSFALFSATGAHAIECLNGQSADILRLESWDLLDGDDNGEKTINIALHHDGSVGIRLIDATVRFEDVLGERIGEFPLERADGIGAGAGYILNDVIAGTVLERLESLHPDDVMGIVCVRALVYEDGTLEEFAS